MSGTGTEPTRRVTLRAGGQEHSLWTSVEITRDLADISASFILELHDAARIRRALPGPTPSPLPAALEAGAEARLLIDGELVLVGYVDDVKLTWSADGLTFGVSGRDRTGDLVDCAASLAGPVEYRGLTLTEIVTRICAPFDIKVRAETDVGAAFPLFSIDVAETAMEAIEKACRQRAVLATSDGVGGLVLTRGGNRRAPAPLSLPGNVQDAVITRSWRERHSAYVVKGQMKPPRSGGPALVSDAAPVTPETPPAGRPVQAQERTAIVQTGRADDSEITRYRPLVTLAKAQSGGASVQTQAEWQLRVARGKSDVLTYTVLDWRAGDADALWRPNELSTVDDPLAGILGDMIVAGVTYQYGEKGSLTRLQLMGPEAFDLVPEGSDDRRRGRRRRDAARPQASTPDPVAVEVRPR